MNTEKRRFYTPLQNSALNQESKKDDFRKSLKSQENKGNEQFEEDSLE